MARGLWRPLNFDQKAEFLFPESAKPAFDRGRFGRDGRVMIPDETDDGFPCFPVVFQSAERFFRDRGAGRRMAVKMAVPFLV